MSTGLIHTFEGRVAICLILAFLGLIVTIVLTIIAASLRTVSDLVLAASALRGGHALIRGVAHDFANRHSTGWWFLRFLAVFVGLPVFGMLIVTFIEITTRILGDPAPAAVAVAFAGLVAVPVFGARHMRRPVPVVTTPPPLPHAAPMPQPGHFLPDNMHEWPR